MPGQTLQAVLYVYIHVCYMRQLTFLRKSDCRVVCLTLLASFFLPSHLSLKHVHVHVPSQRREFDVFAGENGQSVLYDWNTGLIEWNHLIHHPAQHLCGASLSLSDDCCLMCLADRTQLEERGRKEGGREGGREGRTEGGREGGREGRTRTPPGRVWQ